jgi:hypothetical protein
MSPSSDNEMPRVETEVEEHSTPVHPRVAIKQRIEELCGAISKHSSREWSDSYNDERHHDVTYFFQPDQRRFAFVTTAGGDGRGRTVQFNMPFCSHLIMHRQLMDAMVEGVREDLRFVRTLIADYIEHYGVTEENDGSRLWRLRQISSAADTALSKMQYLHRLDEA